MKFTAVGPVVHFPASYVEDPPGSSNFHLDGGLGDQALLSDTVAIFALSGHIAGQNFGAGYGVEFQVRNPMDPAGEVLATAEIAFTPNKLIGINAGTMWRLDEQTAGFVFEVASLDTGVDYDSWVFGTVDASGVLAYATAGRPNGPAEHTKSTGPLGYLDVETATVHTGYWTDYSPSYTFYGLEFDLRNLTLTSWGPILPNSETGVSASEAYYGTLPLPGHQALGVEKYPDYAGFRIMDQSGSVAYDHPAPEGSYGSDAMLYQEGDQAKLGLIYSDYTDGEADNFSNYLELTITDGKVGVAREPRRLSEAYIGGEFPTVKRMADMPYDSPRVFTPNCRLIGLWPSYSYPYGPSSFLIGAQDTVHGTPGDITTAVIETDLPPQGGGSGSALDTVPSFITQGGTDLVLFAGTSSASFLGAYSNLYQLWRITFDEPRLRHGQRDDEAPRVGSGPNEGTSVQSPSPRTGTANRYA